MKNIELVPLDDPLFGEACPTRVHYPLESPKTPCCGGKYNSQVLNVIHSFKPLLKENKKARQTRIETWWGNPVYIDVVEVLSDLFKHITERAKGVLGPTPRVIVSVPAWVGMIEKRQAYYDRIRHIFQDACPGAECGYVFESHAAYHYFRNHIKALSEINRKAKVMLLDMGAGTTDGAVIETTHFGNIARGRSGSWLPKSVRSEEIGGATFDQKIFEKLVVRTLECAGSRYKSYKGSEEIGAQGQTEHLERYIQQLSPYLRVQAEKAKIDLCSSEDARAFVVRIPYCVEIPDLQPYEIHINRSDILELWHQHFQQRLAKLINDLLDEARMDDASDIDFLLLAGGGSRSLIFGETCKALLREHKFKGTVYSSMDVTEHRHFNYDVAVGFGCAYWAEVKLGDAEGEMRPFVAQNPISFRLTAAGKKYWKLVVPERQAIGEDRLQFPIQLSRHLTPGRSSVDLRFYEGTPSSLERDEEAFPIDQVHKPHFSFDTDNDIGELNVRIREEKGIAFCSVIGFLNDGAARTKHEIFPIESARVPEQQTVLDCYSPLDFYDSAKKKFFGLDLGTSKTILSLYTVPA